MAIEISTATPDDIPHIQRIAHEVWPVAYTGIISQQQIDYMLDMMYSHTSLQQQMNEPETEFLIASVNGIKSGFAAYEQLNGHIFKLHKLYVLSTAQGAGLGKMLLEEVCSRAAAKGGHQLQLQVNKRNKAKQFYEAHGFAIDRELVLDIGGGFVMDDYVMKRML
jgi:diamine N-acetyltransferase